MANIVDFDGYVRFDARHQALVEKLLKLSSTEMLGVWLASSGNTDANETTLSHADDTALGHSNETTLSHAEAGQIKLAISGRGWGSANWAIEGFFELATMNPEALATAGLTVKDLAGLAVTFEIQEFDPNYLILSEFAVKVAASVTETGELQTQVTKLQQRNYPYCAESFDQLGRYFNNPADTFTEYGIRKIESYLEAHPELEMVFDEVFETAVPRTEMLADCRSLSVAKFAKKYPAYWQGSEVFELSSAS